MAFSGPIMVDGIERLEGSDNFTSWKIAMEMKLVDKNLWTVIEDENIDLSNDDIKKKNLKAKAKILLSINPSLYTTPSSHLYAGMQRENTVERQREKAAEKHWDNFAPFNRILSDSCLSAEVSVIFVGQRLDFFKRKVPIKIN